MTIAPSPNPATLAAFGVAETPVTPLDGGRGLTWRASSIVLRPHDALGEARWKSDVLSRIEHNRSFCTARPVASATGGWVHDGWEAWTWLPGAAAEDRVVDVIEAGRTFHAAVAGLPRPVFLDDSDSPWSIADRMAWEEVAHPGGPFLARLAQEFRPVLAPAQLIHGDLLGNVLFSQRGRPPSSTGPHAGDRSGSVTPSRPSTPSAGTTGPPSASSSSARTCLSGLSCCCGPCSSA